MPPKTFSAVIELANSGQRFPVMKLAKDDPSLAAMISKLVAAPEAPKYGNDGNRTPDIPNAAAFQAASNQIGSNVTDARTTMQLLPDMELSAQILISSVLSPKDMTTTEFTIVPPEGLVDAETQAALVARLRTHFEQDYKIKPLLPKILRDMLFETGSYPVAVIPENSLDEAINADSRITMESLAEFFDPEGTPLPLGLLGPAAVVATPPRKRPGLSMEGIQSYKPNVAIEQMVTFPGAFPTPVDDTFLSVSDNPSVLKIPALNQRVREARVLDALGSRAMESFSHKLNDRQLTGLVYKQREYGYRPIASLKTQEQLKRRTVGEPLITRFPSESVIPVHVPSSPEVHIGYFIMVDADGYPVSVGSSKDYYQQMSQRLSGAGGGGFASSMLAKVQNGMDGFNLGRSDHQEHSKKTFASMVEADLLGRLRNGVYGNGVALAKNDDMYMIMLARMLAKQHTQMLFLPVELMTYFAFRYNENGIGESLMDGMKILNSLRAMLMFADVMAAVRNSIGRTDVKLKLDEDDPDPKKAIEIMQHEIINSRKQAFPLGANSPTDLVDYLTKAGYEFSYEGHPGLPDISVEFSEKNTNYTKSDPDLTEYLRKAAIGAVGLSPENVDAGFQAEFATSIVSNNLLLTKRVMQIQEGFTPQLADHMRKVAMNSENLCTDLMKIISDNFAKLKIEEIKNDQTTDEQRLNDKQYVCNKVLRDFLLNFEVTLPSPNSVTLDNQVEALKVYSDALDAGLEHVISDSFFTQDVGGEAASLVGPAKAIVKAQLMRTYMADNGILPELLEITTLGDDNKPMIDFAGQYTAHVEALTKALGALAVGLHPLKAATDEIIQGTGDQLQGGGDNNENADENAGGEEEGGPFADDEKDLFAEEPETPETGVDNQPAEEKPAETPPAEEEEEEEPPAE